VSHVEHWKSWMEIWTFYRIEKDGSTSLSKVDYPLFRSLSPAQIRDISVWRDPKKWRFRRIHPLFLSFYPVSIAIISNHHGTLLKRFWFDFYSPRDWDERKVSDFFFRSSCITLKKLNLNPSDVELFRSLVGWTWMSYRSKIRHGCDDTIIFSIWMMNERTFWMTNSGKVAISHSKILIAPIVIQKVELMNKFKGNQRNDISANPLIFKR
jgi:hypothetical protein